MTHSDVIWQILAALAIILTQIATYLRGRRKSQELHVETTDKIDAVQETVNGNTDALHGRIDQLTDTLKGAEVPVPNHRDV